MTGLELALRFSNNEERMKRFREAVNTLRSLGFEQVLSRLNEPEELDIADPLHAQMAAFSHARMRGWTSALEHLFYFDDAMLARQSMPKKPAEADYGADDIMKGLDFTEEEIQESKD